jgi:hypothetical protein
VREAPAQRREDRDRRERVEAPPVQRAQRPDRAGADRGGVSVLPADPALMRQDDTGVRDTVGPQRRELRDSRQGHPAERSEPAPRPERGQRPGVGNAPPQPAAAPIVQTVPTPPPPGRGTAGNAEHGDVPAPAPAIRRDDTGVRDRVAAPVVVPASREVREAPAQRDASGQQRSPREARGPGRERARNDEDDTDPGRNRRDRQSVR